MNAKFLLYTAIAKMVTSVTLIAFIIFIHGGQSSIITDVLVILNMLHGLSRRPTWLLAVGITEGID